MGHVSPCIKTALHCVSIMQLAATPRLCAARAANVAAPRGGGQPQPLTGGYRGVLLRVRAEGAGQVQEGSLGWVVQGSAAAAANKAGLRGSCRTRASSGWRASIGPARACMLPLN